MFGVSEDLCEVQFAGFETKINLAQFLCFCSLLKKISQWVIKNCHIILKLNCRLMRLFLGTGLF